MASNIRVAGPSLIWVGTGTAFAYQFLAYTEDPVNLSLNAETEDVNADYGGRVPVDILFHGEQATIDFTALRYDEAVMQKCVARLIGTGVGAPAPGAPGGMRVGTLMQAEGFMMPLLIYSIYSSKAAFSDMVAGYLFGAAWLDRDWTVALGTSQKRPRCRFRAIPTWTLSTLTPVLYSNTMPGTMPAVS